MPLMTPEEYEGSLRSRRPHVWVRGKRVTSVADELLLRPGVNAIRLTYEFALRPELSQVMLVSGGDGRPVNRFAALDRGTDDLMRKLEMCRILCQQTGCALRYVMHDALGGLAEVTHVADEANGTEYAARFAAYLDRVQREDLVCAVAMTDPKGSRRRRPHQQADPDAYLRVVECRTDGMVVRGAKANITGAPYTHELLVMPSRSMTGADADYAIAFAVPVDAAGLRIISTPAGRPCDVDAPFSSTFGQSTSLVVFDDVLIPWEHVFLFREPSFAGTLTEVYTDHHRHSCIGCRAGLGDMIIGAAAEMADANGLPPTEVKSIRASVAELIRIVESWYACGVAASVNGRATPAGNWAPHSVYANVGKLLLAQQVYDMFRIAHEIAGGIVATVPTPEDVSSADNAALIEKYLVGASGIPASHRIDMARFLQDLTASKEGGWYGVISAHGGGSPEAMRISAVRRYDLKSRRQLARHLACLARSEDGCGSCGSCSVSPGDSRPEVRPEAEANDESLS
jgi:4-hydroxybutyryl-CoA dehydratase/vinylacetyl-CoA-Delta-isomerase